jgi:hypothetical protein
MSWVDDNQEGSMRRYEQVSGTFFCALAIVQLARVVAGWPVQVATVTVPIWASVVAFLVTASLAAWAFRSSRTAA